MHKLKLNITDQAYQQFMRFVNILPKGSIEFEALSADDTSHDPYFEKRKAMIEQRMNDIDSGRLSSQSFNEFETKMDDFEKELEQKYGHQ